MQLSEKRNDQNALRFFFARKKMLRLVLKSEL